MNYLIPDSRLGTPPRRQRGMTLVEIMVALLISLVLLGGVLQVFSSSRQSNRVHEATARMQETGRMALEMIARDVRMADFWGCATDVATVSNHLNPAGGTDYIDFAAGGILGTEGGAGVADSISVRGGINAGLALQPPYGPLASANLSVPAGNDLDVGDIVLVSDCLQGDVFQITAGTPDTSGAIVHTTVGGSSPGNVNATNPGCPGTSHCLSKIYGADATVFTVQEVIYTVGAGADGQPALFRNGIEYLDGVEDLQILYGEDTDGNAVADYYVDATQVADMGDVVSIRFAVVTRSYNDNLTGDINQTINVLGQNRTAADERLRQVYTTTVNIRNRI